MLPFLIFWGLHCIHSMPEKQKAIAAVLLGNFFFGTSVIAVKHISPSLMAPMALTCVRILSGTFLFWGSWLIQPDRMQFTRKDFGRLFLCALTGIAFNQSFSVRGMSLTSPIHASLLVLTTPIVITFLAAWLLNESLNLLKLIGLALGIGGGALLVFSRDLSAVAGQDQALGDSFVIMGAVSYALYVVGMRPLIRQHPTKHILPWVFLFGTFLTLPLGWSSLREVAWLRFDRISWFCLGYVILGATFFAYRLMNYSIQKLGASLTGSFIYTQPFFAAVASILILHEQLSLAKITAAALIMGGVFLANYKK